MATQTAQTQTKQAESIIFVGSGVVFGGESPANGGKKKALSRFNTHHLLKTDDEKLITKLRNLGYDEITEKELQRIARDPNTFHQKIMEDYVYKKEVIYLDNETVDINKMLRVDDVAK